MARNSFAGVKEKLSNLENKNEISVLLFIQQKQMSSCA